MMRSRAKYSFSKFKRKALPKMANKQLHRRTLETQSSTHDEEEEELELEVKKMAESILHYRTTLPDRLNKTFDSLLATQRPVLPSPPPHPPPSQITTTKSQASDGDHKPDVGDDADQLRLLSEVPLLEEEDHETAEKIRLLKLKISSNISSMPFMLKRMKEVISRIDKLELQKESIHPAFKRTKTC